MYADECADAGADADAGVGETLSLGTVVGPMMLHDLHSVMPKTVCSVPV